MDEGGTTFPHVFIGLDDSIPASHPHLSFSGLQWVRDFDCSVFISEPDGVVASEGVSNSVFRRGSEAREIQTTFSGADLRRHIR